MIDLPRIPLADYVRDPAPAPSLNAGVAHTLLTRSARHAWMEHPKLNPAYFHDDSEASDLGSIAHSLLLEGDRSRIVVVPADDWRTKAAKQMRDDARATGKLPILAHKMEAVEAMVDAAGVAIRESELADVLADARVEQTMVWQEAGVWLRSRPDWISADGRVLVDYKTHGGSAEPDAWARGPLLSMGYDLQAAIGLRGAAAHFQPREPVFVFVVQETEPPYAVSFVGLAPQFVAFADQKLGVAIERWGYCLETNRWPGYPSRIAWAEAPTWATYQFGERQAIAAAVDDGRPLAEQLSGEQP